jgi:uncharacterized protein
MNKRLTIILSVILAATLLAACAQTSIPANSAVQPPQRTLLVNGNGQVYLTPNIAYINIGVRTESDTVGNALQQNNAQSQAVANALKEQGVDPKDIQTSSFNVYPNQQTGPQGEIIKTTYVVENVVYVTVRDMQKLGTLLDIVVRSGANTINSITFDATDKTEAEAKAREMAIKDARSQAEAIAKYAGVGLGDLQSISLSENNPVPMYEGKGGSMMSVNSAAPISAGQLVITVQANLVYAIK